MARQPEPKPGGVLDDIRGWPWFLKLMAAGIAVAVVAPLLLPLAYGIAGIMGVLIALGAGAWAVGWMLVPRPVQPSRPVDPGGARRYCEACGEAFDGPQAHCPQCDWEWTAGPDAPTVGSLAALLNGLTAHAGVFDPVTLQRIRAGLEARLREARAPAAGAASAPFSPPSTPPMEATPPPAPPPTPRPALPPRPTPMSTPVAPAAPRASTPFVTRPTEPPGPTVGDMGRAMAGWAAERQADILLYVGAFLLSVAAIIFVAYQGESISGALRFAILTAYAAGFLGFGLALHRWERVKEAGPAFLALGAILVPIDFLMLRTQVLSNDQVPTDLLTLFGSASTAALYFALALRGYGKWYAAPGVPAALLAWGALGSVLNLPVEWYGPWFQAVAAPVYVLAVYLAGRWPLASALRVLAVTIGAATLVWTHAAMALDDAANIALPLVHLPATIAIAVGLRIRGSVSALAVLSPRFAMTALTLWWALFGLPIEWHGLFFAFAGIGYLVIAHFDRQERATRWGLAATVAAGLALAHAHATVFLEDADHAALAAMYACVFIGAASAFGRWRWTAAGGALPPLGAATLLVAWWAGSGLGLEWYASFVGLAALGYLALALFDREERTAGWQLAAALVAALSVGLAHVTVAGQVEAERAALPTAHAIVLAGAAIAFARWRWEWRVAPAGLPASAALTALTVAWAAWDLQPEWFGAFAAAAGIGYLLLAHFDEPRFARIWAAGAGSAGLLAIVVAHGALTEDVGAERAALPVAYAVVLVGLAAAFARWRWTEAAALLPPVGAMTALTAWWASPAGLGVEWYGAFAAAAGIGYLALAFFDRADRLPFWRVGMVASGSLALTLVHASVVDSPAERWALPATYALVLLTAASAFARWAFAWRLAPGMLPALAAMTTITTAWAGWDPGSDWLAALAVPAAAGYVALSFADREATWPRLWLNMALLAGGLALAWAHGAQVESGATAVALPVVYGALLAAATVATARWRFAYREMVAVVPLLVSGFGASLLWATIDMPLEWLSAWMGVAAVGYLVPGLFDEPQRPNWRVASAVVGLGAIGLGHCLALTKDTVAWQLPVTYGVLLAGWVVDAVRTRDVSTLLPPILAAVAGGTALWAAGAGPEWWPYPALGIAALVIAARRWWALSEAFASVGWVYSVTLATSATLVFLPVLCLHPEHGVAAQCVTAGLLVVAAFWSKGGVSSGLGAEPKEATAQVEQALLLQAAFAFLFGAGASLNGAVGLTGADRAWVLAGLGVVAWGLAAVRWPGPDRFWTFVPVGLAGLTVSFFVAAESPGTLTATLALATIAPLVAFVGSRRWMLLGIANTYLLLTVWAGWTWQDADIAYLPLGLAAVALVEWAAFVGLRRYTRMPGETDMVVTYISWAPWLAASSVAGLLLSREQSEMAAGESIVNTTQWGLAAAVLALASAAVVAEGLRLRMRWVWLGGSIGLLTALLMSIASFEPANVQAYAAPIGVYLVAVALSFRRSPELFGENVRVHEGVMLLGALFLVLPPAEQSFEPGGGQYGLELLGIGVGLLLVGLLLHARWLVAIGVVTLTSVSLRMVTGGLVSTPYWLLFGMAGTLLIGFGVLLLLERERWDRFRADVVRWWQEAQAPPAPVGGVELPGA